MNARTHVTPSGTEWQNALTVQPMILSPSQAAPSLREATTAKATLRTRLGQPAWLRGIGIGGDADGYFVKVNVAAILPEVQANVPAYVGNVRVRVEAVGDIAAFAPPARIGQAEPSTTPTKPQPAWYQLSAADLVTLSGYGLGIWWCLGGPTWAGITSVIADEVDGRLARATGTACDRGGELDWGVDVALVPLSLLRLGREIHQPYAVAAAIPILYGQAHLRGQGFHAPVGSPRAVIMLTTMLLEGLGYAKKGIP